MTSTAAMAMLALAHVEKAYAEALDLVLALGFEL
jgi:hypothetical protein